MPWRLPSAIPGSTALGGVVSHAWDGITARFVEEMAPEPHAVLRIPTISADSEHGGSERSQRRREHHRARGDATTRWDSHHGRTCSRRCARPPWFESRCRYRSRCSRIASTVGFEPTTIGLEVRRSILAELRALPQGSAGPVKSRTGSSRGVTRSQLPRRSGGHLDAEFLQELLGGRFRGAGATPGHEVAVDPD